MTKRILQIIPTLDRAGAEKQLCLLAGGLPRDEFDVHVCALTRGGPLEAELTAAGIPLTIDTGRASFRLPVPWAGSVRLAIVVPGDNTNVGIFPGLITGSMILVTSIAEIRNCPPLETMSKHSINMLRHTPRHVGKQKGRLPNGRRPSQTTPQSRPSSPAPTRPCSLTPRRERHRSKPP